MFRVGNMPVRKKVFITTLSVASLGILGVALLLAASHREGLRLAAHEDAKVLAATVAEYAVGPLVFEDPEGAATMLAKLQQNGAVRSATILDRDQHVFASYGSSQPKLPAAPRTTPQAAFEGDGLLVATHPVTHKGQPIGTLRIVMSTRELEAQLFRDTRRVILASAFLIALCALLAARLSRLIADPILQLSEVMRRVGTENLLGLRVEEPSADEIGTLYRGFNTMLDQIRARVTERDLSEARVRALVRAMPDSVFVLDEAGRYVEVLAQQAEFSPQPETSIIGTLLFDSLSEPAAKRVRAALDLALQGSETRRVDYELVGDKGTRFIEAALAPLALRTADQLRTLLVVARDVSERRVLEERLLQAHKLEAVGQLAGGIAHDFNNLLCGIMGYAELLRMPAAPGRKVEQIGDEIVRISEHAAQLTSRLLGFARKSKAQSTPADMNEVIARVSAILERTLDRRIQVERELSAEPCMIDGDAAQLESTILNLGLNARDAMPSGGTLRFGSRRRRLDARPCEPGGEVADESSLFAPGDYIEVWVADTGQGIPEALRERIFEPFFTTKPAGKGSGLGLATVTDAIRAHQGLLRVESGLGQGTVFRLYLPALRHFPKTEALVAAKEPGPEHVSGDRPRGRGHVLVVDDEPSIREVARLILEDDGYRVSTASNGREAVEQVSRTLDIELVILDMVMPVMNGAEAANHLKRFAPHIPILIVSGYSPSTSDEVRADGFLQKPFTSRDLARTVNHILAQAHGSKRASIPNVARRS